MVSPPSPRRSPTCTSLGNAIPSIAFGTWTIGNGQGAIDQVEQAISVGFSHVGTLYTNVSSRATPLTNTCTGRYRSVVRKRGGSWESRARERAREKGHVHHHEVLGASWTGHTNVHPQQPEECAHPSLSSISNGIRNVYERRASLSHARA